MKDEELEIAQRRESAQRAWDGLMMTNIAGISAEQKLELDLRVERARQELDDAEMLYRQMVRDRVKRERLN
tara:strand:+ start:972 stop:1184 length:213 start_codon:yes stop_codon:yes gene_type:complete